MTEYPKKITIQNDKLKKLLEEKAELIVKGRAKSEEVVELEKQMAEVEKELIAEEEKVNLDEFKEKEKEITDRVNVCIEEMNAIKKEIHAKIKAETPEELRTKYDELKKLKDDAETQRNKIAIKATKYNHKIIPLGKKLMKPFIEDEYEDYDSLALEDGEIVCSLFSHLNDFKVNFAKKKA